MRLLKEAGNIAVVGLSSNPARPSHNVASYLKGMGYRIFPVNPHESEILGQKSFASLDQIKEKIDIVDVFRKPAAAPEIIRQAVAIGAGAVWLQESVVSPEAFRIGDEAGLTMIMDRCMFKEHSRLIGDKK